MKRSIEQYRAIDMLVTNWMATYGLTLLRISLGIVFLWFGALKFFPGLSPAESIATRTISIMSFGLIEPNVALCILAAWETAIGTGLLLGRFLRATILLLLLQMAGTLSPFLFFPMELFTRVPIAPTLEGQYIIKNVVIISAALVIGATVRGGAIVADPEIARLGKRKMAQEKRAA